MSTERRHPNVVNRDEVEPTTVERGKHRLTRRSFTRAAGNQQLGASLFELPPGALSYPFHYHCGNEEAAYVISGSGIARIGESEVRVGAGDWIAYPAGPASAHQMINDGEVPLVFLAVATEARCDVIGYPDSDKVAAWDGDRWLGVRPAESLDYWDGEPEA